MSNLSDEPVTSAEEELNQAQEPASTEARAGKRRLPSVSFSGEMSIARRIRRILLGVIILVAAVALNWSRIPPLFDVEEVAYSMAEERGHFKADDELPIGYRTVSTVIHLSEMLLNKFPGQPFSANYVSNDVFSPALTVDNIRNWEYGVVLQLRFVVQNLRNEFSRSRAQSTERPELIEADARFSFDHKSWVLPRTEDQFKEGIEYLEVYLNAIAQSETSAQMFVARQDVLDSFLRQQQRRMGSFTVRLRSNVGGYKYNPYLLTSEDEVSATPTPLPGPVTDSPLSEENNSEDQVLNFDEEVTPFFQRDDEFYEIRGSIFVLYHVMLAIKEDYRVVLDQSQAMGMMNRILSELYAASKPMQSPFLLQGQEFGIFQNHSLTMAAHLAQANNAMGDLRVLLRGGADL